jgi:hypothetical protein
VPLKPQAFIFNAYGTLFVVHSVVQREQANTRGEVQFVSSNSWDELGISVDLPVLSLDQIASSLTQGNPSLANKIP